MGIFSKKISLTPEQKELIQKKKAEIINNDAMIMKLRKSIAQAKNDISGITPTDIERLAEQGRITQEQASCLVENYQALEVYIEKTPEIIEIWHEKNRELEQEINDISTTHR